MKPNPFSRSDRIAFSFLVTLTLLCTSCASNQTLMPTTKPTLIPATSTPPPTLTPVPQTFGDTVTAPECVKGGQPDTKAFDELIESLMPSLYEMESFRYKTVYRYTTAEGYPEDELSVEVEGAYSGLLATSVEDYTFPTQMYERSHTVLTDLRTRARTEAIAIEDAFWIRGADSTTDWMAFTDPAEMQNLAEIFSPQIIPLIMGVGDLPAPLMAQTETLDGREVLHRCWIPQASEGEYAHGASTFMTIFDDWTSLFSGAEVHLWTAEDDTQLVQMVISGKYIGDSRAFELVEPETPTDFLLWMDIFEVNLPIEIEAPSEIALTLPGSDSLGTPTVDAPYNELPLPTDAIVVGTFDESESNTPEIPREYLFPDKSFSYDALTTYTGEGWPSDPIDRQLTYQTAMGFTEAAMFYLREMNHRGWELQEKYFQFGLQELYLFFKRDEITMPIILGPGEQGGTHISAILPPSDDELEAILNGWVSYTHENSDLPEGVVSAIAFDKQGRAWIGTNNGQSVFDGKTWITYSQEDMGLIPERFSNRSTTSLAVDLDGRVWVGTYNGLAVFDGKAWKTYTPENSNLAGNDIQTLAVDQQGHVWLGLEINNAGNISTFDGKTFTNYTPADIGSSGDDINAIALDQQSRLWIGTDNGGVYFFDGTDWKVALEEKSPTDSDYRVEDIAIDQQGQIWIGTWWKGLSMYNGESWATFDPNNSVFPFEHIDIIAVDANDKVWVGTSVGGLAVFGNDSDSKIYTPLNATAMGNNWYALAIDEQGRIWVGTNTGLYVFTPPKP